MHAMKKLPLAIYSVKTVQFSASIIGDPSSEASKVSTAPNGCF